MKRTLIFPRRDDPIQVRSQARGGRTQNVRELIWEENTSFLMFKNALPTELQGQTRVCRGLFVVAKAVPFWPPPQSLEHR